MDELSCNKNLLSKPIVEKYYSELTKVIQDNKPILSIILVGSRQDSLIYVNIKKKRCQELGIICNIYNYDNDVLDIAIIDKINELNNDINVNGIMVQLPIPKNLDKTPLLITSMAASLSSTPIGLYFLNSPLIVFSLKLAKLLL